MTAGPRPQRVRLPVTLALTESGEKHTGSCEERRIVAAPQTLDSIHHENHTTMYPALVHRYQGFPRISERYLRNRRPHAVSGGKLHGVSFLVYELLGINLRVGAEKYNSQCWIKQGVSDWCSRQALRL